MNLSAFKSKWLIVTLAIIGELIIILAVFRFGIVIGHREADFGYKWGENYGRIFGDPGRGGFFQDFSDGGFPNPHGDAGIVLKVETQDIVVKDNNNNEKIILINSNTVIRKQMQNLAISDIKVGDMVVVIGSPNNSGEIQASLIRIFPAPPQNQQGNFPNINNSTGTNQ